MSRTITAINVLGLFKTHLTPGDTYTFSMRIPYVYPVYEHIGSVDSPVRTLDTDGNERIAGDLFFRNFEIRNPDDDTFEIRVKSWQ